MKVYVDFSRVKKTKFMERKPGSIHIGDRYIPLEEYPTFLECLWRKNHYTTVNKVAMYLKTLYADLGRKKLTDLGSPTEIFEWEVLKK